jgi:DNA repair photolyase
VSRRTDVPAFYGEWFRNRFGAGWCETRNPFSGQVYRVSMLPQDVLGWVFWSRDYRPFLDTLQELHDAGQRFICHFTITGFPSVLEPRVPSGDAAVETARSLASAFGPDVVQWRYDPILLTSLTPPQWHEANFAALAARLEGATRRCIFSFPTMYRKTIRNLESLEVSGVPQEPRGTCPREASLERKPLHVWSQKAGDFTCDDLVSLSRHLAAIAAGRGMQMQTCCNDRWIAPEHNIVKAHCADWPLLQRLGAGRHLDIVSGETDGTVDLFGEGGLRIALHPTRKECGCYKSVDIGCYETCGHGCAYCYAVDDPVRARRNLARHQPDAPALAPLP